MSSLSERLWKRFAGLDRVHGRFVPDPGEVQAGKKVEGSTSLIHQPIVVRDWDNHLAGRAGLGICPIRDDAMCIWGVIDIDVYTLDHLALLRDIKRLKLPLIVFRTKSGGAHCYLFLSEDVDAETVRLKLMDWAIRLGHAGVEIFPKQARLTGKNDFGSWLNMPYYAGERTTRYALDEEGRALTVEEFLVHADYVALTKDQLLALQPPEELIGDQLWEGSPPCLRSLAIRGFPDGTRNNALFNIAVYLRKRFDDGWGEHLDAYNQQFMQPPMPSKEVQNIIKSVGKKSYGYKCKDAPIRDACNKQICLTCAFGVGGGNDDPGVQFGDLQKLTTDPVTWIWDVDGRRIQLATADLTSQPKFHSRCIEELGKWPNLVKPATWQRLVREKLERVEIVDVPREATEGGLIITYLEQFCTGGKASAKAMDEILMGKVFTENGRNYFRVKDFIAYLHQNRVQGVTTKKVYLELRNLKAENEFKQLKGKGVNLWHVPEFQKQTEAFATPRADSDAPKF